MINKITLVIATIALLLGGVAITKTPTAPTTGGIVEFQKKSFVEGFYAGTGREVEVTRNGDLTLGGGTLNVTTANTATSTVIAGCFQFYATSTDTALKFQASTTPGAMYSQYGSCPNL